MVASRPFLLRSLPGPCLGTALWLALPRSPPCSGCWHCARCSDENEARVCTAGQSQSWTPGVLATEPGLSPAKLLWVTHPLEMELGREQRRGDTSISSKS